MRNYRIFTYDKKALLLLKRKLPLYNKTMFSDTHFHFKMLVQERGADGIDVLTKMAEYNCFFGLDIGTKPDDLLERESFVDSLIAQIKDPAVADKVRSFMYFSAGLWPEVDFIHNREECVAKLEQSIQLAAGEPDRETLNRKIIAIGECGIDHHWNPGGADGRSEEDFDQKTYEGEREMFEMQSLQDFMCCFVVPGDVFDGMCWNVRLTQPADSVVIKAKLVQIGDFKAGIRLRVTIECVTVFVWNCPDAEKAKNMV